MKKSNFSLLKKDYLKYLKKQEILGQPFKDKHEQLENYYIPISKLIYQNYLIKKKVTFIGLSGAQGSSKTTITEILKIILKEKYNLNTVSFSIDDFYKTLSERKRLSKNSHKLFLTRGVPGTHDLKLLSKTFKNLQKKFFTKFTIPKFDKSKDDRMTKRKWTNINRKPEIVIFEGWCVGAKAETNKTLKKSINSMEKDNDQKLIWRKYVNQQLKTKYKKLYSQLNCMIYLKAKNFSLLQKWRLKQEHKLWLKTKKKGGHKIMSKEDVINFMQTYQRITQNMFKNTPKYASIILNLNSNHQIKTAVYKSK